MKICIPIESDKGFESKVDAHFGGAPYFLTFDAKTETVEVIENKNRHHGHGWCRPIEQISTKNIDVVVCLQMGIKAVQRLNSFGIKVMRAPGKDLTVPQILKAL